MVRWSCRRRLQHLEAAVWKDPPCALHEAATGNEQVVPGDLPGLCRRSRGPGSMRAGRWLETCPKQAGMRGTWDLIVRPNCSVFSATARSQHSLGPPHPGLVSKWGFGFPPDASSETHSRMDCDFQSLGAPQGSHVPKGLLSVSAHTPKRSKHDALCHRNPPGGRAPIASCSPARTWY